MLTQQEFTLALSPYPKKVSVCFDDAAEPVSRILYFHGGGLLFGSREDLPALHKELLTKRGHLLLSFDYPLAPGAEIGRILEDVLDSVRAAHTLAPLRPDLPYFLWGRSAGAYLTLLAAASGELPSPPRGILSYYGYGFFQDSWQDRPAPFYQALPPAHPAALERLSRELRADGDPEIRYSLYVYARQSGLWRKLFFSGKDKEFYPRFSLRAAAFLPCPLFCAHSIGDPDVPFQEFSELSRRFQAARYIAPGDVHDFDRDDSSGTTRELLEETAAFLDRCLAGARD